MVLSSGRCGEETAAAPPPVHRGTTLKSDPEIQGSRRRCGLAARRYAIPTTAITASTIGAAHTWYLLHHQHRPAECAAAFAAWRGFESPLRHHAVPSTCLAGGHAIWWRVEAPDERLALALLPAYVGARTTPIEVRDVEIP
jgi:hypothetical protein